MPRNASGRPRCLHDQCKRRVGQDNDDLKGAFITGGFITSTTSDDTTRRASSTSDVLGELEESWPLIPLRVLLLTDASPREICRRLRLNVAIRLLCEAIAEADAAGATW